jgi:hypothetical protein
MMLGQYQSSRRQHLEEGITQLHGSILSPLSKYQHSRRHLFSKITNFTAASTWVTLACYMMLAQYQHSRQQHLEECITQLHGGILSHFSKYQSSRRHLFSKIRNFTAAPPYPKHYQTLRRHLLPHFLFSTSTKFHGLISLTNYSSTHVETPPNSTSKLAPSPTSRLSTPNLHAFLTVICLHAPYTK